MVTPGSSDFKVSPNDRDDYRTDSSDQQPRPIPSVRKDFKQVLDDDGKKAGPDAKKVAKKDVKSAQNKEPDSALVEEDVSDIEEPVFSLFTPVKPKKPTESKLSSATPKKTDSAETDDDQIVTLNVQGQVSVPKAPVRSFTDKSMYESDSDQISQAPFPAPKTKVSGKIVAVPKQNLSAALTSKQLQGKEDVDSEQNVYVPTVDTGDGDEVVASSEEVVPEGHEDVQDKSLVGWPAGGIPQKISDSKVQKESPFNVYKEMTKKDTSPQVRDWDVTSSEEASFSKPVKPTGTGTSKVKEKSNTRFDQDQPDLSYVNPVSPQVVAVGSVIDPGAQVSPGANAARIQEIVDRIVDGIYTLENTGKTDTIITLKNIPLFADARIVISAYDSATKEFNLSFENLRPDAKQIIDINLASLRTALEDKGNVLHIVTTTTFIEHPITTSEAEGRSFGREREEERGGQKQQKQGKNEQEA